MKDLMAEMGVSVGESLDLRRDPEQPTISGGGNPVDNECTNNPGSDTLSKAAKLAKLYAKQKRLTDERTGRKPVSVPAEHGEASVDLWLVDTGCGNDLISKTVVRGLRRFVRKAAKPITFITANGKTQATEIINLSVNEFNENIQPYILDSTPAVVSVGFR